MIVRVEAENALLVRKERFFLVRKWREILMYREILVNRARFLRTHTPLMPVMKGKAVPKTRCEFEQRVTEKSLGLGYLGPEKNVHHALDVWYKR